MVSPYAALDLPLLYHQASEFRSINAYIFQLDNGLPFVALYDDDKAISNIMGLEPVNGFSRHEILESVALPGNFSLEKLLSGKQGVSSVAGKTFHGRTLRYQIDAGTYALKLHYSHDWLEIAAHGVGDIYQVSIAKRDEKGFAIAEFDIKGRHKKIRASDGINTAEQFIPFSHRLDAKRTVDRLANAAIDSYPASLKELLVFTA